MSSELPLPAPLAHASVRLSLTLMTAWHSSFEWHLGFSVCSSVVPTLHEKRVGSLDAVEKADVRNGAIPTGSRTRAARPSEEAHDLGQNSLRTCRGTRRWQLERTRAPCQLVVLRARSLAHSSLLLHSPPLASLGRPTQDSLGVTRDVLSTRAPVD